MNKQKEEKIIEPEKEESNKTKIKTLAKEAGLVLVEGITFSFKTIRQGLKWATADDAPKAQPKKAKKRDNKTIIIIK